MVVVQVVVVVVYVICDHVFVMEKISFLLYLYSSTTVDPSTFH